jgi:hypothetical protein
MEYCHIGLEKGLSRTFIDNLSGNPGAVFWQIWPVTII